MLLDGIVKSRESREVDGFVTKARELKLLLSRLREDHRFGGHLSRVQYRCEPSGTLSFVVTDDEVKPPEGKTFTDFREIPFGDLAVKLRAPFLRGISSVLVL